MKMQSYELRSHKNALLCNSVHVGGDATDTTLISSNKCKCKNVYYINVIVCWQAYQRLYNSVIRGIHVGIKRKGTFTHTVICGVTFRSYDPVLRERRRENLLARQNSTAGNRHPLSPAQPDGFHFHDAFCTFDLSRRSLRPRAQRSRGTAILFKYV